MPCPNCNHPRRGVHCRGLCYLCYADPGVRARYPARPRGRFRGTPRTGYEPTAEEVEATVREQSRNLPWWWEAESEKVRNNGDDS